MNLAELMADFERRRVEADRLGASAPLATVYALFLEELKALDGAAVQDRMMTTAEAASVLALAPRTVARRAARGCFLGAEKTSADGEWRLPARSVYRQVGVGKGKGEPAIPRLWDAHDG